MDEDSTSNSVLETTTEKDRRSGQNGDSEGWEKLLDKRDEAERNMRRLSA
jgi:hypothetical protein